MASAQAQRMAAVIAKLDYTPFPRGSIAGTTAADTPLDKFLDRFFVNPFRSFMDRTTTVDKMYCLLSVCAMRQFADGERKRNDLTDMTIERRYGSLQKFRAELTAEEQSVVRKGIRRELIVSHMPKIGGATFDE